MLNITPLAKMVIGVSLMVVAGVIIPLLMVIHIIEPTFLLVFGSYAASTSGLFLGIIGVVEYVTYNKKGR